MSDTTLREELGIRSDPEFELDLPPGWTRRGVTDEVLHTMQEGVRTRLMEAQNPQLHAEVKALLEQSFATMRRDGAFAFFSATDPDPGTLFLPASIVASVRTAAAGGSLDDLVRTMVRQHGAAPLNGDPRTMRSEKERTVRLGAKSVINHSVVYLTPIPGSHRRRALQLTAGFGREPDSTPDDPLVVATRVLFDSVVSTLRWRTPRAS